MESYLVAVLLVTAMSGVAFGVAGHRALVARAAKNRRRIPAHWQLQARPLLSDVERMVWRCFRRAFFDHHVLTKVPVIRFLFPLNATQGQHSHELLKGVYCSFTVCATDGTVIGCIDVPGDNGLKASNRNLKQKLFDECGIAYAVLSATELPPMEALRAAFLGDLSHADQRRSESVSPSQPALTEPAPKNPVVSVANPQAKEAGDVEVKVAGADRLATVTTVTRVAVPGVNQLSGEATPSETSVGIDMVAVAAARHSLQAKLDDNRKARIAKIESLSASMDIIEDNADKNFVAQWDDSFIMGEESKQTGNGKP